VECVQDSSFCDRVGGCTVHLVWGEMGKLLVDFLDGLTLADLVARQEEKDRVCPSAASVNAIAV
jgi:DNA-binding IscR family transcriptional regulator